MSTNFERMKKTKNKCDDLNVKMKTDGKLICGCGGDNEFEYNPNLFDCRLFGLFLRKAENSHKKYKGILSKLNLLETAIFENKETGDSSVIQQKVNNIIDEFSDINLNNQTRDFIVKYMTDKTKRKEDYNRYQLMSTLQSALNYIEIARNPQMEQLLTIVSTWVSKSDKIIKGVSVSQQEVNKELTLTPADVVTKIQPTNNIQSRDAKQLVLEGLKAKKPYSKDEDFQRDARNVKQIMLLLDVLSKNVPNYFDSLKNKLSDYQTKFETLKDENIYKEKFHDYLFSGEDKRLVFDTFRKLNEKMDSLSEKETTDENLKKTKKSLNKIFDNYRRNISKYNSGRISSSIESRDNFISNLYTLLLLSKDLENNSEFKSLMEYRSVKNSMKTRSIISDNLQKLLDNQYKDYARGTTFKLQFEIKDNLTNMNTSIKDTGKFEESSNLITSLIEGRNNKEKYINFDYDEPKNSSYSSS